MTTAWIFDFYHCATHGRGQRMRRHDAEGLDKHAPARVTSPREAEVARRVGSTYFEFRPKVRRTSSTMRMTDAASLHPRMTAKSCAIERRGAPQRRRCAGATAARYREPIGPARAQADNVDRDVGDRRHAAQITATYCSPAAEYGAGGRQSNSFATTVVTPSKWVMLAVRPSTRTVVSGVPSRTAEHDGSRHREVVR